MIAEVQRTPLPGHQRRLSEDFETTGHPMLDEPHGRPLRQRRDRRILWSLKHEWTNHEQFADLDSARLSVFKYIETFYNTERTPTPRSKRRRTLAPPLSGSRGLSQYGDNAARGITMKRTILAGVAVTFLMLNAQCSSSP
ncbi:MAG: IS3 family transposase, partial [Pirellulales bacterium]